jgi:hypothetical protein
MDMSAITSIAALLISLFSFLWTWSHNRKEVQFQLRSITESTFINVEQMLASVPSALKFHGITIEELKQVGVTPEEFAYILSNFTAGGILHRTENSRNFEPFDLNSYRGTMIQSDDTRKVWPILRKCIAPSPYRDRIEATIRKVEKIKEQEKQKPEKEG